VEFARLLVKGRSLVVDVAGRQKFSGRNWLNGSANQNTIHNDIVTDAESSRGELVFGGNILEKCVGLASEVDSFAGLQIGEPDQNVVAGIELKHVSMHLGFETSLPVAWQRRAVVRQFRPAILKQQSSVRSGCLSIRRQSPKRWPLVHVVRQGLLLTVMEQDR
jgi:hypothetical protein